MHAGTTDKELRHQYSALVGVVVVLVVGSSGSGGSSSISSNSGCFFSNGT